MGMQKMRARRTPANQAHSTSARDNPIQVAADAAEGGAARVRRAGDHARRGALRPARGDRACRSAARSDAAACSPSARWRRPPSWSWACAASPPTPRRSRSTAPSRSFVDGDDTPWSKAFLASAYASRGIKMRFTSGTGSEVQMGNAEGKSMLYLEIRCILMAKGAGVQGLQNGSISCIGVPGAVPRRHPRRAGREPRSRACVDLECASGNDQSFSHSSMRRTARLMPQLLPGTDFVCSGYSAVPNYDNMFAGSNFDTDDYDDWNTIQRDLQVDGGAAARPGGRDPGGAQPGGPGAAGAVPAPGPAADHRRGGRGGDLRQLLQRLPAARRARRPQGRAVGHGARAHRPRPGQGRWRPRGFHDVAENLLDGAAPARLGRPAADVGDPRRPTSCRCRRSTTPTTTPARAPATACRARAGKRSKKLGT